MLACPRSQRNGGRHVPSFEGILCGRGSIPSYSTTGSDKVSGLWPSAVSSACQATGLRDSYVTGRLYLPYRRQIIQRAHGPRRHHNPRLLALAASAKVAYRRPVLRPTTHDGNAGFKAIFCVLAHRIPDSPPRPPDPGATTSNRQSQSGDGYPAAGGRRGGGIRRHGVGVRRLRSPATSAAMVPKPIRTMRCFINQIRLRRTYCMMPPWRWYAASLGCRCAARHQTRRHWPGTFTVAGMGVERRNAGNVEDFFARQAQVPAFSLSGNCRGNTPMPSKLER